MGDATQHHSPGHSAALPCRPSLRARGLRPTAANGEPTLLLTPNVLGSVDSKSRANFCTPERLGSFSAAETPCPRFRSSGWSVRPCHASKAHVPPPPAPCTSEQTAAGSQRQAYGHGGPKRRPDPSLPGVWVQMQPNAGWPCGSDRAFHREGLSSPMVERGLPAHLPVSTVVFYLQQGLFSKSSLKWLCLSSLLRYELKKKTNNKTKNQTPTTINTKTLTHQTLAACVTHKPHQYSVKKLILLKTIHSTRD